MTSGSDIPLEQTKNQINQVIQTEIELGMMVHDYQATLESKEGLINRVHVLTEEFEKLNRLAGPLTQQIPLDVVGYIEDGRNPRIYTREFVELLSKQNQYINAKMRSMSGYRDALASQIKAAYPEMNETVDDIVKRTSAPPKE